MAARYSGCSPSTDLTLLLSARFGLPKRGRILRSVGYGDDRLRRFARENRCAPKWPDVCSQLGSCVDAFPDSTANGSLASRHKGTEKRRHNRASFRKSGSRVRASCSISTSRLQAGRPAWCYVATPMVTCGRRRKAACRPGAALLRKTSSEFRQEAERMCLALGITSHQVAIEISAACLRVKCGWRKPVPRVPARPTPTTPHRRAPRPQPPPRAAPRPATPSY